MPRCSGSDDFSGVHTVCYTFSAKPSSIRLRRSKEKRAQERHSLNSVVVRQLVHSRQALPLALSYECRNVLRLIRSFDLYQSKPASSYDGEGNQKAAPPGQILVASQTYESPNKTLVDSNDTKMVSGHAGGRITLGLSCQSNS